MPIPHARAWWNRVDRSGSTAAITASRRATRSRSAAIASILPVARPDPRLLIRRFLIFESLVMCDWGSVIGEESTITDPLITNEPAIKDLEIHNVGQGLGLKFNATPLMQ